MRTIMHNQVISIVGVGGLGSIVAEHLIHMGFQELNSSLDVLNVQYVGINAAQKGWTGGVFQDQTLQSWRICQEEGH